MDATLCLPQVERAASAISRQTGASFEDVVGDMLLNVCESAEPDPRRAVNHASWRARDAQRSERRQAGVELDEAIPSGGPAVESQVEQRELRELVRRCVATLDADGQELARILMEHGDELIRESRRYQAAHRMNTSALARLSEHIRPVDMSERTWRRRVENQVFVLRVALLPAWNMAQI